MNNHKRQQKKPECLAIIVPCFNEAEVIEATMTKLLETMANLVDTHGISGESYIVLVNDGSVDETWRHIESMVSRHPGKVRGIGLACNVGHQAALLCGLNYVADRCDISISIDADLQDDLGAIEKMLEKYRKGAEIVLGVRDARDVDTWFKRSSASLFYKAMRLMGVDLIEHHADFRLMSSKTLKALRQFGDANLFLRGLPPLLHSRIATVTYRRAPRVAGETKYPLKKMLSLAWNGITSFSVFPLRLISFFGGAVFLASLGLTGYAVMGVISGEALPGWASVVIPLYLLGGLVMLSIGVVGEYVGKVFLEVKNRPRFIIDTVIGEGEGYE